MKNSKRPLVPQAKVEITSSLEEHFQNETLRPIIKSLNNILMLAFNDFLLQNKINYAQIEESEKGALIQSLFQKNSAFKNQIIGMVLGNLSQTEYEVFLKIKKACKRRITQIVAQRYMDSYRQNDF